MTSAPSPQQSRRARRQAEPAPSSLPVLVLPATLVFAALVALAASVGYAVSVLVFTVLAVALAAGWARLLGAVTPRAIRALLLTIALLLAGTLALTDGSERLRWLPVTVAVGVIGSFVQQLLRRDGRGRLTAGVAASSSGLATMASGAATVSLSLRPLGAELVTVAMAALAAGALAGLTARARRLRPVTLLIVLAAGVVAATGVAALVAVPLASAVGVGALVATLSFLIRHVLATLPDREYVPAQVASAAASVLLPGVVLFATAALADL